MILDTPPPRRHLIDWIKMNGRKFLLRKGRGRYFWKWGRAAMQNRMFEEVLRLSLPLYSGWSYEWVTWIGGGRYGWGVGNMDGV